jgi:ribose 1,5-bisphosphokinase PhnN
MQDAVIGLTGPSGVGKDTLAQALQRCPRKDAPSWVVVQIMRDNSDPKDRVLSPPCKGCSDF